MTFGGLKTMWLMVMFDLPTETKKDRFNYSRFRKGLLEDGFMGLQFSVYARPCPSDENIEVHRARIRAQLPPRGEVRVLSFTDKQFARMAIYHGKVLKATEKPPEQLTFF